MKNRFATCLLAVSLAVAGVATPLAAHAQSDASALSMLSALPIASVVASGGGSNDASQASGVVVAIPLLLSVGGVVLVVKAVHSTARGTVYVLERVSDGARTSVEVVGKGVGAASLAVGTSVTVSTVAAGTVLSAAGEAIAFLPNELGRALMYNQRLTN